MYEQVCRKVFDWLQENLEELGKAVRGHGDFYRVRADQILQFAGSSCVPCKHIMLLAAAYGYYILLLQVPAIMAVKKMTDLRLRRQPIARLAIDDVPSISEIFSDLRLWNEIYKADQGQPEVNINAELLACFQASWG